MRASSLTRAGADLSLPTMPLDRSSSRAFGPLGALAGLVALAACTDKAATPSGTSALTGTSTKTTAASAVAYVDTAVSFENYYFIPAWHSRINWPADSTAVLDSLTRTGSQGPGSDTAYYGPVYYSIYTFLRNAGDQHSDFFSPTIAPGSSGAVNTDPTGTLAGYMLNSNAGVKTGSPVAYVWYPAYDGNTDTPHVDSTQNLIRSLDQNGPCGYVLDLRYNYGGSIFPMIAGLSPLIPNAIISGSQQGIAGWGVDVNGATYLAYLNNGAAGYTTSANTPTSARDTALAIRATNPYTLRRPNSPVAILLDTVTASAAEFITLSFRGGSVPYRTFGGNTYGVTTTPYNYEFHDGGFLNIAAAIMRDRTGTYYGESIAPDTPVAGSNSYATFSKLTPSLAGSSPDATVQAAVAWLNTQTSCGGTSTARVTPSFVSSAAVGAGPSVARAKRAAPPRQQRLVSRIWMVSRPRVRRTIEALRRQH